MTGERPTRARIDLEAAAANAQRAQAVAEGRAVIAVVKADAYGHGAVPLARAFLGAGCTRLAVVTVREAEELREAGIAAPILVLGGVHDAREAERAASLHLIPVVHHAPGREWLARAAAGRAPLPVQVEVDTGMSRMGVPWQAAEEFLRETASTPGLVLEGVFTHLASADEPDLAQSFEQLRRFQRLLEALRRQGLEVPWVHAANSAALLTGKTLLDALPEANAVRPGLMLYGARPALALPDAGLQPVMHLETQVAALRRVGAGTPVGYGAAHRAPEATTIATLPLGYADGILRSAGNRGAVRIHGQRCPIVGRVSMDYVTVDVGGLDPEIGDPALVFGRDETGALPVEEAAAAAGTLAYELLVQVGGRVPRHYPA
ncbi:MAG: alanine racemase [Proteobacteria bacterium]|nr:alanine racemase [Pseudomonadota bacterium]